MIESGVCTPKSGSFVHNSALLEKNGGKNKKKFYWKFFQWGLVKVICPQSI